MKQTVAATLQHAILQLSNAVPRVGAGSSYSEMPALDAEILLGAVLGQPRSYLHAHPENILTEDQYLRFARSLARRVAREPIAYITGRKEFWSLNLLVTNDTLIPRPETELLVAAILERLDAGEKQVADLGTGSGAIALALARERPAWRITATDVCERALRVAKQNALDLQCKTIQFYSGNWCEALPANSRKQYNAIVSNPPYISESEWVHYSNHLDYEPKQALLAGDNGLAALNRIIKTAKNYLRKGGYIALEHGHGQGLKVKQCLQEHGYKNIKTLKDLQSSDRVSLAVNPE